MVQVCFQKHGPEPSNLAKSWPKPIPHASPPKGRTHNLNFLADLPSNGLHPPPNSPCPSKPLGEEMELISLPLENVSHTLHPRYEFGWDELHLAREPQEPGPPPEMNFYDFMIVAAVTGGCLNPHDCG